MKQLLTWILIISLTGVSFALGERPDSVKPGPELIIESHANQGDIRIVAKGVVCSFCAQGLQKTFAHYDAVERIVFDDVFNVINLYIKEGMHISDPDIKQAVIDAGYIVETIERKGA